MAIIEITSNQDTAKLVAYLLANHADLKQKEVALTQHNRPGILGEIVGFRGSKLTVIDSLGREVIEIPVTQISQIRCSDANLTIKVLTSSIPGLRDITPQVVPPTTDLPPSGEEHPVPA